MKLREKELKFCVAHANVYEESLTSLPIGTTIYTVERVPEPECQLCKGRTEVFRRLIEGEDP